MLLHSTAVATRRGSRDFRCDTVAADATKEEAPPRVLLCCQVSSAIARGVLPDFHGREPEEAEQRGSARGRAKKKNAHSDVFALVPQSSLVCIYILILLTPDCSVSYSGSSELKILQVVQLRTSILILIVALVKKGKVSKQDAVSFLVFEGAILAIYM